MPTIKLATGKSLDAVRGHVGIVPFKCWDTKGSQALLDRIMARYDAKQPYFIAGPKTMKGLMTKEERGVWHRIRTKKQNAGTLKTRKSSEKQETECNIHLRGWRARTVSLRGGQATKKKYQDLKSETVSINMGHGRPSKLHIRIYDKEQKQ